MGGATNVLDPSALLHTITQSVPNALQTPYDALAAATHAMMLAVGFRFAGLGDDARQEGDGSVRKLPDEWNAHGPHSYAFRYSHPQSNLTFVIKSLKLGERWIVHGLAIGDDKTATLDIAIQDYTSSSFFPYDPSKSTESLVHGFISSSRLNDLAVLYKINVIQRLMPGLQKPGYEETTTSSTASVPSGGNNQQPSSNSPPRPEPGSGPGPLPQRPPIFDDPISADDPALGPYNVGRSDLEPLGGNLRMPGDGGGMFVGPDHPMFRDQQQRRDPSSDVFGGPQPLPRGAVPPGARFDPIGPFGNVPGRGMGPRPGRGGFGPGRSGFFSGEPDNDELPPPGSHDMFL